MRALVFVTLLGLAVCSGDGEPSSGLDLRTSGGDRDEDGASLAIVFDTTRSMFPELAQVKKRAAEILQASLTRPGWPVKDFVLAPFNDPVVPEATVTTDPNEFQQLLDNITVEGGLDCFEKALTGLLNALKVIRPRDGPEEVGAHGPGKPGGTGGRTRSTVFVFTDASAKDYHLVPQVLKIVQRKQPVVVFVTSGVCKTANNASKEAFSEIASISSGHIFQLEKTDVGQVMDILDKSLQEHKVNLLSVDKPAASMDQHTVLVDRTIHEILVVISGSNPEIIVTDPSGQLVDIKPLVSLENVKVIALKEPDPGSWKINTSSSSPHTVRFTGISTIDFVYGFSAQQTDFIDETYHRPLKGAENFVLVASSGMGNVWNLTNIELTALDGQSTHKMQLEPVGENGFYRSGPFIPTDTAFYLTSYGFGTDGYPLKRITPTAILPEIPAPPQIYLQERQTALIGRQITLYCQIESLIPMTAWWSKEDRPVSRRGKYKQTATVILTLDVDSEDVAGEYQCVARNAQGVAKKSVSVSVTGPPPEVLCPDEQRATTYGRLTLECTVMSSLRHHISWSTPDGRALDNNTRYTILPNGTMIINPVWPEDTNLYHVTVTNSAGTSTRSIKVFTSAPMSVQIEPTSLKFEKGHSFSLNCVSSGETAVRLSWKHTGHVLENDRNGRFIITSDGISSLLQVSDAVPEDEGVYTCVAQHTTQKMPSVESSAECRYVEQPEIVLSDSNPLVKLGNSVTVTCSATGLPAPEVTWSTIEDGQKVSLFNSIKYEVQDSDVTIHSVRWEDDGMELVCEARNEVGMAETTLRLQVGSPPYLVDAPTTKHVLLEIFQPGTLTCDIDAIPTPTIAWKRNGDFLLDKQRFRLDRYSGDLNITDVQFEDRGIFECIAENIFGRTTQRVTVTISGLELPAIASQEEPDTVREVIMGTNVSVDCVIVNGIPKPLITWYHNEQIITEFDGHYKKAPNESLLIEGVEFADSGQYKCEASNEVGKTSATFIFQVIMPPEIIGETTSVVTAQEGDTVFLPCKVRSGGKGNLTWTHSEDLSFTTSLSDEGLIINELKREQGGLYVCSVSNEAGTVNKSITLNILVPPEIVEKEDELSVVAGVNVFIPCVVSGNPSPNVSWTKDDSPVYMTDERYPTESGLVLHGVAVTDSGEYTCLAENEVGSARSSTQLTVSVPAWIERSNVSELSVLKGESAFLPCKPNGSPFPEVGWTFRGLPLNFTNNEGLKSAEEGMEISAAKESDSGVYTCSIANAAGSDSLSINLTVNVPPEIAEKEDELSVVAGVNVFIPCVVSGNPSPNVSWTKDDSPVYMTDERYPTESGLVLLGVAVTDSGEYTCLAENEVGSARSSTQLSVSVPAWIERSNVSELSVLKGESAFLPCKPNGSPFPEVGWTFRGLPLNFTNNEGLKSAKEGMEISAAKESDSGVYTCSIANAAGSDSQSINLTVNVPAKITSWDLNPGAVMGQNVTLNCTASGFPNPEITWYYQETVKAVNSPLRFVALPESAGKYQCAASNKIGTDTKDINLTVLVPPQVKNPPEETIVVSIGLDIDLHCLQQKIPANPKPSLNWYFNDTRLTSVEDPLILANVNRSDEGTYVCKASNSVANVTRKIVVKVHERPHILEKLQSNVTLSEGEDFSMQCSATGNPPPEITWYRDDKLIPQANNDSGEFLLMTNNTLVIIAASSSTEGNYTCIATNEDGQDSRTINIKVDAPLSPAVAVKTLDVVEKEGIVLNCSGGEPNTWYKDGSIMDFKQHRSDMDSVRIKKKSSGAVEFADLSSDDSGNYTCVSGNGKKSHYKLNVLTEPSFDFFRYQEEQEVPEGQEVFLDCQSSGNPTPKVIWRKDDSMPVTQHTTPGVVIERSNRSKLRIPSVRLHHAGTYRCIAVNKAGQIHRDFRINVIVAPYVVGSTIDEHEVMVGANLSLDCPISGHPKPRIVWERIHDEYGPETIDTPSDLESSLVIDKADLDDSGEYSCTAVNKAGSTKKLFKVFVLEPPKITDNVTQLISSTNGSTANLLCESHGWPQPSMYWLRNGHVFDVHAPNENLTWSSDASSVTQYISLHNLSEKDGGTYVCTATNLGGTAEKSFHLQILVAPFLGPGSDKVEVHAVPMGRSVSLRCAAAGQPPPTILWYKNGQLMDSDLLSRQDVLSFWRVGEEQAGNYTCVASNVVGNVSKNFQLDILVPPFVVGKPGPTEYEVLRKESVTLHCNVSGRPEPHLVWLKGASTIESLQDSQSRGITLTSENKSLVISDAELWHSGRYSCLASNEAGSEEVAFTVVVSDPPERNEAVTKNYTEVNVSIHRRTALVCAIQGYPQPNITWYKNGQLLTEGDLGEQAHVSSDGRQLLVLQAGTELSGDYYCEAVNRAGSTRAFFTLEVEVPAEWSEWSDWGPCSVTCGAGRQERYRECVQNGKTEKECEGEKTVLQMCFGAPCPVNGGWGEWSAWSPCSQSCGTGNRVRNRKCDQPEPEYGGEPCQGSDQEVDSCAGPPCPVDGQWSEWSHWSECSASCGDGAVRSRSRQCDNPEPHHSGSQCAGLSQENAYCETPPCPEGSDSGWSEWTAWSDCKVPCGTGQQMRRRYCVSRRGGRGKGRDCLGDNLQIKSCEQRPCRGDFPKVVSLHLRGNMNGRRVRNDFSARIVRDGNIVAKVHNIHKRQAIWQNWLPFILSPVSWSVAKENGDAANGYSLTKGSFRQSSHLVFDSGEQLSIEHEVKGNDDEASLQVDVNVHGKVPRPRSDVLLNPITEDLVQTGANSLQSLTSSSVVIDGKRIPYTWNKTIIYDPDRGTMPYRAERVSTKDISTERNSNLQEMRYSEESIVTKFDEEDRCPNGFQLNQRNRHCIDLDECETPGENGCHPSQHCENLIGSYRCYCSEGYRSLGFGQQCLDVNECMTIPPLCSHECRNIPGSYVCLCPIGMTLQENRRTCQEIRIWNDPDYYDADDGDDDGGDEYDSSQDNPEELEFRRTQEDWSCPEGSERGAAGGLCVDSDECLTGHACREHEACLNTRGSFECIDTTCPVGYRRYTDSDDCVKLCVEPNATCSSGATVAETRSYIVLNLEPSEAKPKMALVHLAISQEGEHTLPRSSFKILGKQYENLFKVREDNGHGVLYSTRQISYNTKYRILLEANSYGATSNGDSPPLLYTTKFIVTLYVLKW